MSHIAEQCGAKYFITALTLRSPVAPPRHAPLALSAAPAYVPAAVASAAPSMDGAAQLLVTVEQVAKEAMVDVIDCCHSVVRHGSSST